MPRRSWRRRSVTEVVRDETLTGQEMKLWRERCGLSSEEAASALGVALNTFRGYESERRSISPSIRLLTRYIEKRGVMRDE